jgi:hypothetical protein
MVATELVHVIDEDAVDLDLIEVRDVPFQDVQDGLASRTGVAFGQNHHEILVQGLLDLLGGGQSGHEFAPYTASDNAIPNSHVVY